MKLILPCATERGWIEGFPDDLGKVLGLGSGVRVLEIEVKKMFAGQIDKAASRMKVSEKLATLHLTIDGPEDDYRTVGSPPWIDTALDFNFMMLAEAKQYEQSHDAEQLEMYPAAELILDPRTNDAAQWRELWKSKGGSADKDGRLFALKNHGAWLAISRFGHCHPPYSFTACLSTQEISWLDAKESGWAIGSTAPSSVRCPGCA